MLFLFWIMKHNTEVSSNSKTVIPLAMRDFAILTYHDYLSESVGSFTQGIKELKQIPESIDGNDRYYLEQAVKMRYKYSFLMIANSLEAAANALLSSLHFKAPQYDDIEKLSTMLKFELFCKFKSSDLERGNAKYGQIKQLITARNEFVHPKPKRIPYSINDQTNDIEYNVQYTKGHRYPLYLYNFEDKHVVNALHDVLDFIGWICFDICKLSIKDGSLLLGLNSVGHNSDIYYIEREYDCKFDKRSMSVK